MFLKVTTLLIGSIIHLSLFFTKLKTKNIYLYGLQISPFCKSGVEDNSAVLRLVLGYELVPLRVERPPPPRPPLEVPRVAAARELEVRVHRRRAAHLLRRDQLLLPRARDVSGPAPGQHARVHVLRRLAGRGRAVLGRAGAGAVLGRGHGAAETRVTLVRHLLA